MGCTTQSSQGFTDVIVDANILHAHTHIRDLYTCNIRTPYLYTCDTYIYVIIRLFCRIASL